jgi:hypothetical protein
MSWVIEETDDCGVHWRRAELTEHYPHFGAALTEASEIILDEWRPPRCAFEQLIHALGYELVAHYWDKGIRIVSDRRVAAARRHSIWLVERAAGSFSTLPAGGG